MKKFSSITILCALVLTVCAQTATNCPATVSDYDGNVYKTILIGSQCWTKENLKSAHYSNGESIALCAAESSYFDGIMQRTYRFYPGFDRNFFEKYGYLYSFKAATHGKTDAKPTDKIQGVCPKGWHIPNYDEVLELTDYIENSDNLKCGDNCNFIAKALASTAGWNGSTQDCAPGNDMSLNDATGFSAMPAGISCSKVGDVASFWTSEPYVLDFAYTFAISANGKRVTLSSGPYAYIASSVRCIKD